MDNTTYNGYALSSHEDFGKVNFKQGKPRFWRYIVGLFILLVALAIFVYTKVIPAPKDFPADSIVLIEEGTTLKDAASMLKEKRIIRSPLLFQMSAIVYGGEKNIIDGYYGFKTPIPVYEVARRVVRGDRQLPQTKITIPEGLSLKQMADVYDAKLEQFDKEKFLTLTKGKEGYLFPDTYFFFPFENEENVIEKMSAVFDKKIASVQNDIDASGRSLKDIIIMASIIEKESSGNGDREIISGILWKRIAKGIRLQVDATFLYINGKESKELTVKDLDINSPYNTYRNEGLPPGPIVSPGLASIKAALHPEDSPYLFYLHDPTGQVHFAKTFDEHKKNIAAYLR